MMEVQNDKIEYPMDGVGRLKHLIDDVLAGI